MLKFSLLKYLILIIIVNLVFAEKNCPKCKKTYPDSEYYCGNCGSKLVTKIKPKPKNPEKELKIINLQDFSVNDKGMSFRSEPIGAVVYINGDSVGITPFSIDSLVPGKYKIRLTAPNYQDWIFDITISEPKPKALSDLVLGIADIICNPNTFLVDLGKNCGKQLTDSIRNKDIFKQVQNISGLSSYDLKLSLEITGIIPSTVEKKVLDTVAYKRTRTQGCWIGCFSGGVLSAAFALALSGDWPLLIRALLIIPPASLLAAFIGYNSTEPTDYEQNVPDYFVYMISINYQLADNTDKIIYNNKLNVFRNIQPGENAADKLAELIVAEFLANEFSTIKTKIRNYLSNKK